MKKKTYYYLIGVIVTLIFVLISITIKYKNETIYLSEKMDTLLIENRNSSFIDTVLEINILHQVTLDSYIGGLYVGSAIYFCLIKNGNNKILLNDLSKSSKVCESWINISKNKYVEKFSLYKKETNESSVKEFYDCALGGVDIVDSICL